MARWFPRYRWWTVFGWNDADGLGVKVGPLTIMVFVARYGDRRVLDRHEISVCLFNRWTPIDTGLSRLRART